MISEQMEWTVYLGRCHLGSHDPITKLAATAYGAVLVHGSDETEHWGRGGEKSADDMAMYAIIRFAQTALTFDQDSKLTIVAQKVGTTTRLGHAVKWLKERTENRLEGIADKPLKHDNADGWLDALTLGSLVDLEMRKPRTPDETRKVARAQKIAELQAEECHQRRQHLKRGMAATDEGIEGGD
jgi:hypothetical protein